MSTIRVSSKRKITIPEDISRMVGLKEGDILDAEVEHGKIVLTPKESCFSSDSPTLSPHENKLLASATEKIKRINDDPLNSRGLEREEIEAAIKAGLIEHDQAYFWTEEWQENERASERDKQEGRFEGDAQSADELIADLEKLESEA